MDKKKMDEILDYLKKMESVPQGINNINQNIMDLRDEMKSLGGEVTRLKDDNCRMRRMVDKLQGKIDYLENQSRRQNLDIRNLPAQVEKESWADVEGLITGFINKELKIKLEGGDIERAHRVARNKAQVKPIVVKFSTFKKKDEILRNSWRLKGSKVLIQEDFSERVIEERRKLLPLLKEAKGKNLRASLTYNRLKVENKVYVYDYEKQEVVMWKKDQEDEIEATVEENKKQYQLRTRSKRDDFI